MKVERTASGLPFLRLENVFLLRGHKGAWSVDFMAVVGHATTHVMVHIGRRRELDQLLARLPHADTGE